MTDALPPSPDAREAATDWKRIGEMLAGAVMFVLLGVSLCRLGLV